MANHDQSDPDFEPQSGYRNVFYRITRNHLDKSKPVWYDENMRDRREYQKQYSRSSRGKESRLQARQKYENSEKGLIRRLARRLKAKQKQTIQVRLRDNLRLLKLRGLQTRIRAAIDSGRLTTYSIQDDLYFPILHGTTITDPVLIEEFLQDLEHGKT